jgi:hypothetical protein
MMISRISPLEWASSPKSLTLEAVVVDRLHELKDLAILLQYQPGDYPKGRDQ